MGPDDRVPETGPATPLDLVTREIHELLAMAKIGECLEHPSIAFVFTWYDTAGDLEAVRVAHGDEGAIATPATPVSFSKSAHI